MRKFAALLIALLMTAMMCAGCGAQTEPETEPEVIEQTDTSAQDEAETVTDYTVHISDNVPDIYLEGTYLVTKGEPLEGNYDTEVECINCYEAADANAEYKAIGYYTWQKTEETLLAEAEKSAAQDYPEYAGEITVIENDFWETPGDSHYAYYCTFDEKTFADYTYMLAFFFEDGDSIIELDAWYDTEPITIGDKGLQYFAPAGGEVIVPSETDAANGMLTGRKFNDVSFSDLAIFTWSAEGNDLDSSIDWYRQNENYKNVEVVDSYTYTSDISGTTYDVRTLKFDTQRDGVDCANCAFIFEYQGEYVCLTYYIPVEEATKYRSATIDGMLYGLFGL